VTPRRIQLRRTKGWRKPPGAVVVPRPEGLRCQLAGRGYHRPFGKKVVLPNGRWLTVWA
jgi:hypothetical protein